MTALTQTQLQRKCLEMRRGGGAKRGVVAELCVAGKSVSKVQLLSGEQV